MHYVRMLALIASLFCSLTFECSAQDPPSLADVARQLREAKATGANSVTSKRQPLPTGEDEAYQFENNARILLSQEKFDELDQVADTVRASKSRFVGGSWKLRWLYVAVGDLPESAQSDTDWKAFITLLTKWVEKKPASITARISLAEAYINYGWKARGSGSSDQVTHEGWQLFEERVKLAHTTLDEADKLLQKCPELYGALLIIAQAEGWSKPKIFELFQKATLFEPNYDFYYRQYALYLLPQWYGEEGESQAFANAIADQIGGKQGDIVYFEIARDLRCECVAQMSWKRIQDGYSAISKQYGTSNVRMNQFAYLAGRMEDADIAETMFEQIGDHWDKETWYSQHYFEQSKNWASQMAVFSRKIKQLSAAVDANLETPEGQQYDARLAKEFPQKFTDTMKECAKSAGGEFGSFELFLRLGKTGNVDQSLVEPPTSIAGCLLSKVQFSSFSPPPKPEYWVKISMNITQ